MNQTVYALLLSTIAGCSTMIGTLPIFMRKKNPTHMIVIALSFAAGIMLTVSITDLIPNAYQSLHTYFTSFPAIIVMLICVVIGIILSMLIDAYLPTPQISTETSKKKLYKVGLFSMIAIILHNIPEGIATFMTATNDMKLGLALAIAITLHNIPEGISISVPIYFATKSKAKALFYTMVSGLSELLGAILAYLFLAQFMTVPLLGALFGIIAGIMIHISIYELIPTSKSYQEIKLTYKSFAIGVIFMLLSHFLMS